MGDFNGNNVIDAADYVAWRKTNGTQAAYDIWRAHFGQTAGSGSGNITSAYVPEPSNMASLLVATLLMYTRRRAAVS